MEEINDGTLSGGHCRLETLFDNIGEAE